MGLDNLLAARLGFADTPDTPAKFTGYQTQSPYSLTCTPDTPDTPQKSNAANDCDIQHLDDFNASDIAQDQNPRPDRQREVSRQKAIAMMKASPDVPRGIYVDDVIDPDNVVLFVASRVYQQTCELLIPRAKYDHFKLLELIERRGAAAC